MTNHRQQKQQMRKSRAKMIPTTRSQVRRLSDCGTVTPAELTSLLVSPESPPLLPVVPPLLSLPPIPKKWEKKEIEN